MTVKSLILSNKFKYRLWWHFTRQKRQGIIQINKKKQVDFKDLL